MQMTMTPTSEVVADFLIREADLRDTAPDDYDENVTAKMREAAALISSLVAERDAAVALNNRYAYERDKAREERDAAERRSEAHWKLRFEQAERLLAEAREALKPFAMEGWADENGWTDRGWPNDRICDWFGPSDFLRASIGGVNGQD
jgi:hypothetical protein